ncbi:CLOCK-interacting pacemaker-like [Pelobates cultripes]|uniref:CLOCK-interacting pacemaker-like n=2 Tax=Pelobates cultripes TaxID=61616 RepID=A0AAD1T180_PELCU|nr:CLOCK-interacting pacemaker-like [Pelobates cultripes]
MFFSYFKQFLLNPLVAVMKSSYSETGSPKQETESHSDSQADKQPKEDQVKKEKGGSEKDSGYSDSSSESFSSEETAGSAAVAVSKSSQESAHSQATYTPIYILQNVVLKQPRLLMLQQPVRRHRKRPFSSSYLPILRSYPRIAPRLNTPPALTPQSPPIVQYPTPPKSNNAPPQILDISLRSLALLRRTRETQRSIRELRVHTKLYNRALQGEEGGWDRLRRAMERSGVYRGGTSSSGTSSSEDVSSSGEEKMLEQIKSPSEKDALQLEKAVDTSLITKSSEEATIHGGNEMDVV